MTEFLPLLLGGVILFLYAITKLSDSLNDVFSEEANRFVQKFVSNVFSALLSGIILTVLLGSSSAVIILVIVFINAKTLTFRHAIGLIMGANIGTTFSSLIISFDVGKFAVIPLLIGFIFEFIPQNYKWKKYGHLLLYFGMLFFGLFIMEQSLDPLQDRDQFAHWIERVEGNPIQGALVGGFITLLIQSSSGTVGMAIVLGKQQLLSVTGGIAIMLGAELGTCSDTLLATIKGSRQAVKAGIFHLMFNLTTICIGLLLFQPFVDLVELVTSTDNLGRQIANAHMLFNVLGVLLFLPFVRPIEYVLNRVIKERLV